MERCEFIQDNGVDCGKPALVVVMAGPRLSRPKPFYACPDHRKALPSVLTAIGFRAETARPLKAGATEDS